MRRFLQINSVKLLMIITKLLSKSVSVRSSRKIHLETFIELVFLQFLDSE